MGIQRKNVGEATPEVQAAVEEVIEQGDFQEGAEAPAAPQQTTEVAQRQTTAVGAPQAPQMDVMSDLADHGFEGLEINFTSFETIILEKSSFASSSGRKIKEDFVVRLQKTRNKFLFSSKHPEQDDREACYSYNRNADKEDPEVMERIKAWQEQDGVGYEVKTYVEALAIMVDDKATGELNGEMVLLQIPPASIGKLSGHCAQQRLKGRGQPNEYDTIVGVGQKIGEGQKAFYPWVFSAAK